MRCLHAYVPVQAEKLASKQLDKKGGRSVDINTTWGCLEEMGNEIKESQLVRFEYQPLKGVQHTTAPGCAVWFGWKHPRQPVPSAHAHPDFVCTRCFIISLDRLCPRFPPRTHSSGRMISSFRVPESDKYICRAFAFISNTTHAYLGHIIIDQS